MLKKVTTSAHFDMLYIYMLYIYGIFAAKVSRVYVMQTPCHHRACTAQHAEHQRKSGQGPNEDVQQADFAWRCVAETATVRRISFVMPSKYDKESLPVPKDAELELKEVAGHRTIVHTSYGACSQRKCAFSRTSQCMLEGRNLDASAHGVNGRRFDSPW